MAYFLMDDNSMKGRDPNIDIINGIHQIKEKTSVNTLVSNYTNKHITFNKEEYIGHLELTFTDDTTIDQSDTHSTNSVTLQKMMAEQVKLDTFDPLHHKLKISSQNKLDALLKEFETQFAKDETSIWMTPLKNDNQHLKFWSCIPKALSHCHKNYQWVKEEIEHL